MKYRGIRVVLRMKMNFSRERNETMGYGYKISCNGRRRQKGVEEEKRLYTSSISFPCLLSRSFSREYVACGEPIIFGRPLAFERCKKRNAVRVLCSVIATYRLQCISRLSEPLYKFFPSPRNGRSQLYFIDSVILFFIDFYIFH